MQCIISASGERITITAWSLISDRSGDAIAHIETTHALSNSVGQHVVIVDSSGAPIWVGYVVAIEQRGTDRALLIAHGMHRLLDTVRYTAFWSDTRFSRWDLPPPTAWSDWLPAAWQHDTNNRLYATTRPGETYGGAFGARRAMAWAYRVPDQSLTGIGWGGITAELLGGMWTWNISAYSNTTETTPWVFIAGVSVSASGAYTLTTTAMPACVIRTVPPSTSIAETNPTDTRVFRATAVRVANHAPPITATEIVEHALTHAQSQLGNHVLRGWRVDSSTADTEIAVWEDATVRDVVAWGAQQLNAEWWVDRTSQAVMVMANRPRRQWTATANALTITTGNDQVITRCYARYRNPAGNRTLRTATAINAAAEAQWRVSRTAVIDVDTTSATTANAVRDAYLAQMSQQPPTATLTARTHGDLIGPGGPAEPWAAEPGDEVLVIGAPPLRIVRRTITREQTTYELTAPAGTLISALVR